MKSFLYEDDNTVVYKAETLDEAIEQTKEVQVTSLPKGDDGDYDLFEANFKLDLMCIEFMHKFNIPREDWNAFHKGIEEIINYAKEIGAVETLDVLSACAAPFTK